MLFIYDFSEDDKIFTDGSVSVISQLFSFW